jgi:formylglycine-generating enzyme required for sulfatase activity
VEIAERFFMGAFQVTQEQWRCVVESIQRTGATTDLDLKPSDFQGEYRPVEQVSWDDCQAWLAAINAFPWVQQQLQQLHSAERGPNLQLQLPTEAHWEWACRAVPGETAVGNNPYRTGRTEYHAGDGERALRECGWFNQNSGGTTHAVGRLRPNALGLYDMHGNVWEWCSDPWLNSYDSHWNGVVAEAMHHGSENRDVRVVRGGSWNGSARWCRSAYRLWRRPDNRFRLQGLRVCLFSGPIRNSDGEPGPEDGVRRQAETESYGTGETSTLEELQLPPRSGEILE